MAGCAGRGGSHHPTACRLPQIAVQNPLVSERLELSVLYKEYAEDDNVYQQKIKVGIRQGGGDGRRACCLPGLGVGSEFRDHEPQHLGRCIHGQSCVLVWECLASARGGLPVSLRELLLVGLCI